MDQIWRMERLTSDQFLASNKAWAGFVTNIHPGPWIPDRAEPQTPRMLWIGCSDSRVPESVIMGCKPGEVFVHRNIANQFRPGDSNSNAVLEFAVQVMKVNMIVIAGHSRCGAAEACLSIARSQGQVPDELAPLKSLRDWLGPLVTLAKDPQIQETTPEPNAVAKLTNVNVSAQVQNVKEALEAMKEFSPHARNVTVHGWVYELETGLIGPVDPNSLA